MVYDKQREKILWRDSMRVEDCIFCKIANGEIPSATIYEDELFRVIMDIAPASKGHAIILPKNHMANIFELEQKEGEAILLVAKKVATAMKDELGCDGINILQNNGEAAGQTVFHLHVHLIPRYKEDQVHIKWVPTEAKDYNLTELAERIANRL